ncbi:MAG: lipopolysaccharide transport periplasmic protein LptA [Betaproteobacteria bacterium]
MKAHLLLSLAFLCAALPVHAEKADRDKPIQVEAQKITVDDAKKVQVLEGDVVMTKGTITIQSDRIVITEDKYGFQKGTAFGGPQGLARFRQKREGKEEYVEGQAERIEYNTKDEIAELFHRAWVKSGEDQVKGDYIWYDSIAEKYLVTAGETRDPKGPPARVRAIIQPKSKTPPPAETPARKGDNLLLKGAPEIGKPD